MRYLWASPTTLVGLAVALTALGRGRVLMVGGVLEVSGPAVRWALKHLVPLRGGASAITLGHVVIGRDRRALEETRAHERVHVRQYERWGPFFVPAYVAASAWALMSGGHYYFDNVFEREAFNAESTAALSVVSRPPHPVMGTRQPHSMPRVLLVLLAALALPSSAWATWSVIAVDKSTGHVVIASATCVDRDDQFLMGVQAVVVPGKGVAACQAAVDMTHTNQMLVFTELQKGTAPARIIEMLSADPAFDRRQFGIVDLQGRSAGHSGRGNGPASEDLQGQVPGTEIYFSIQGNILRPGEVVPRAMQAFLSAKGMLTDRVMAAMEAADAAGGDSRCSCPPAPADGSAAAIPCDGRTSHVAYILMADPADTNGDSHNDGRYAMYLTVSQPGPDKGPGQVRAGENLNPVKTLRLRYDAWRKGVRRED
jgi:uncharacterized Ntn-hydrolase superfamily protein